MGQRGSSVSMKAVAKKCAQGKEATQGDPRQDLEEEEVAFLNAATWIAEGSEQKDIALETGREKEILK